MLSAISNFLPSSLNLNIGHTDASKSNRDLQSDLPSISENPLPSESSINAKGNATTDEFGARKKPKPTPLNETFIVVRPPPAMSNHPLNLQLQLVPPSAPRTASTSSTMSTRSRPSMDESSIPDGANTSPPSPETVIAPNPNRSVTDISIYTSTSTSSLASTSSAASGARRIVPLYNLHAHNVLQNTVLDAGTDAKVARYSKKGMELVDLTFLELFEVWGDILEGGAGSRLPKSVARRSSFFAAAGQIPIPGSPQLTDDKRASMISFQSSSTRDSGGHSNPSYPGESLTVPQLDPDDTPKRSSTRKFFGKVFKKREQDNGLLSPAVYPTTPLTPQSSRPSQERFHHPPSAGLRNSPAPTLAPPILDLQATLIKGTSGARRATSYVWMLRKWLKKSRVDGLKGMISAAGDKVSQFNISNLGFNRDDPFQEIQIRFEWVRSSKTKVKTGRNDTQVLHKSPSRQSLKNGTGTVSDTGLTSSPDAITGSKRSSPERETASNISHDDIDAGEESDPEDSETPWNCTMIIQRLHNQNHGSSFHLPHFHSSHSPTPHNTSFPQSTSLHTKMSSAVNPTTATAPASSIPPHVKSFSENAASISPSTSTETAIAASESIPDPPTRIKVATLYPAPHHPKIVAQMKVPYPLSDVDIFQGVVHRRRDGRPTYGTLTNASHVMTAEEIKDVICSTSFWLVVREGFGGLGKEKRKGDGWRIRA